MQGGKDDFLSAIEATDYESLLDFIIQHSDEYDYLWTVVDESHHEIVWTKLKLLNVNALSTLSFEQSKEIKSDAQSEAAISILQKIVNVVMIHIMTTKYRTDCVFDVINLIHVLLLETSKVAKMGALQMEISKLCEWCWLHDEPGSENLMTHLIPYLLLTSLSPSAVDMDIKRVFSLREVLHFFDFEDPTIESLKDLLFRCFISPKYLKMTEGRQFLSFLFSVDKGLHEHIANTLRPQIAQATRSVCRAYGDVIYRAWKDLSSHRSTDLSSPTDNTLLKSVEDLIQSFLHEAIHAANEKYCLGLNILLSVLHEAKRHVEVDTLLHRLYRPILWRSLRCANAVVRSHATAIFFAAFPLQSQELNAVELDALMEMQFGLLLSQLQDSDHRVRTVAVHGVCRALTAYWEAIPSQCARGLLELLVHTLANDGSSALVRQAVFLGLCGLSENPLSHRDLAELLPNVKSSLNDVSEKLRDMCGFHFYDIVSVDDLLLRLAADKDRPSVVSVITRLLQTSYYPQQPQTQSQTQSDSNGREGGGGGRGGGGEATGPLQIRRCLQFLDQNEDAAVAFYGSFYKFTSVGSAAKIAVMLMGLISKDIEINELKKRNNNVVNSISNRDVDTNAGTNNKTSKTKKSRSKRERTEISEVDSPQQEGEGGAIPTTATTTSMQESPLSERLRVGVLRVILAALHSIHSQLQISSYSASLELIFSYFNAKSLSALLQWTRHADDCCDGNDNNGGQYCTPIYFQIAAILSDVSLAAAKDKTDSISTLHIDIREIVNTFITSTPTASTSPQKMEDDSSESRRLSKHAIAIVELVSSAREENMFLDIILSIVSVSMLSVRGTSLRLSPSSVSSTVPSLASTWSQLHACLSLLEALLCCSDNKAWPATMGLQTRLMAVDDKEDTEEECVMSQIFSVLRDYIKEYFTPNNNDKSSSGRTSEGSYSLREGAVRVEGVRNEKKEDEEAEGQRGVLGKAMRLWAVWLLMRCGSVGKDPSPHDDSTVHRMNDLSEALLWVKGLRLESVTATESALCSSLQDCALDVDGLTQKSPPRRKLRLESTEGSNEDTINDFDPYDTLQQFILKHIVSPFVLVASDVLELMGSRGESVANGDSTTVLSTMIVKWIDDVMPSKFPSSRMKTLSVSTNILTRVCLCLARNCGDSSSWTFILDHLLVSNDFWQDEDGVTCSADVASIRQLLNQVLLSGNRRLHVDVNGNGNGNGYSQGRNSVSKIALEICLNSFLRAHGNDASIGWNVYLKMVPREVIMSTAMLMKTRFLGSLQHNVHGSGMVVTDTLLPHEEIPPCSSLSMETLASELVHLANQCKDEIRQQVLALLKDAVDEAVRFGRIVSSKETHTAFVQSHGDIDNRMDIIERSVLTLQSAY